MRRLVCGFGLIASVMAAGAATTIDYKPQEGSAPWRWEVAENWYNGSTALGTVPTGEDYAVRIANKEFDANPVILSTAATNYSMVVGSSSVLAPKISRVRIAAGGSFKSNHSSTIGKQGPGELVVEAGGEYLTTGFYIGYDNRGSGSRAVIEKGGTLNASYYTEIHQNAATGTASIVNHGHMTLSTVYVGASGSSTKGKAVGYLENDGTISARTSSLDFHVGGRTASTGIVSNHVGGVVNYANLLIGSGTNSVGVLYNGGAITGVSSTVGYRINSTGTLVNGDGGTIDLTGSFIVGRTTTATGHVHMAGTGRMSFANGYFGYANALADVQLQDDAALEATGLYVGIGSASTGCTGMAKLVLKDRAQVERLDGNLYISTNKFGYGEVEIADSAVFSFADKKRHYIYIGSTADTADGVLHLRGGTFLMSTNCTMTVGRSSTAANGCSGRVVGWGRFERDALENANLYNACNMTLYGGSVTADGEGVARDLDLSVFRKSNSGHDGTNASGTNGWYAINKGRLTYPCRNGTYLTMGDYYGYREKPVYVNSFSVSFTDLNGKLIGQLYATDRDDIPAGLPVDDEKATKRLGVWRAAVRSTYAFEDFETASKGSFTKALVNVRYDQFRLNALKNGEGDFAEGQKIAFYVHDGTEMGSWRKVTTVLASEAESTDYVISGEILPSTAEWNMGFFAVVAERSSGTCLLLR